MKNKIINEIHLFDDEGLYNALKKLDMRLDNKGNIMDKNNKQVLCDVCKKRKLSKKNLSAFFPKEKGVGLVCSELGCFILVLYEEKKKEETKNG